MQGLSVETAATNGNYLLRILGTKMGDEVLENLLREIAIQDVYNDPAIYTHFVASDNI
jgi:hypothetical protein